MLDIRAIKEEPERVKNRLATRGRSYEEEIDAILAHDETRRSLIGEVEALKAEQNKTSKEIPAMKKEGKDASAVLARMKELSERIAGLDRELSRVQQEQTEMLLAIPNLPAEDTPLGLDDKGNQEVRQTGEPPAFSFAPKPHWEVGEALGILDPTAAAKVTGSRFHFYKGLGARLERAVINFYLDTHTSRGYEEILPPFLANTASMTGTGQLPKFEEDAFRVAGTDYYLIPTAEVPVTNMHRDEILPTASLPLRYCAYSACFRAEAGSAGRDTRGLIRQHQFNKVELVKFCEAKDSFYELESLTRDAEFVLQQLGLAYRVVRLCTGDMGFASACTYDIEVFMPSYGRYLEISSCSNFVDFQARRAGIRTRNGQGKTEFVHTLNGSGVAAGRTVAALLENFQNEDGSVSIPACLQPYMNGLKKIGKR